MYVTNTISFRKKTVVFMAAALVNRSFLLYPHFYIKYIKYKRLPIQNNVLKIVKKSSSVLTTHRDQFNEPK